jgi:hypothetical protein
LIYTTLAGVERSEPERVALRGCQHGFRTAPDAPKRGRLRRLSGPCVRFKEAGLGTNQLIDYAATADGTAIYVCVNRGGANPSASNKTAVAGPVTATGTFSSGKNGQVTASLTVQPPFQDIGCPPGQNQELASVTYTNVVLTDTPTTSASTAATSRPGACSRMCAERAKTTACRSLKRACGLLSTGAGGQAPGAPYLKRCAT